MKLATLALLTTLGLGGVASAEPPLAPSASPRARGQLQQMLFERFDRNHDGQLEPRERRRAARMLRRLADRIEQTDRARGRTPRHDRRHHRFDDRGDRAFRPGEAQTDRAPQALPPIQPAPRMQAPPPGADSGSE